MSKIKCPRCGIVLDEWPCLSAKDAKQCPTAAAAGVKPKLRLTYK